MAATLKMCLMIHVEDTESWGSSPQADDLQARLGLLATMIGTYNSRYAKISLQVGGTYFKERNAATTGTTSLSMVLANGGNFWPHTHCATYDFLTSVTTSVSCAYEFERGATTGGGPIGRSGGWEIGGQDFVSITQYAGLKAMNAAVMLTHALVPTTARPYAFTDTDLPRVYPHDAAPGPLSPDVGTMRVRPFWMDTASDWFKYTNTIVPINITTTSAVLMIPQAGRNALASFALGRTAYDIESLSPADLRAAMTEIWTAAMITTMPAYGQQSITHVWYKHLTPPHLNSNTIQTIGAWVDSVNAMLNVSGGASALGVWKNMNEITSLYIDGTSRYY